MAPIHHHFEKRVGRVNYCYTILDYSNNFSFNWLSYFKTKVIMSSNKYLKKKSFLIYGLGLTGVSVVKGSSIEIRLKITLFGMILKNNYTKIKNLKILIKY